MLGLAMVDVTICRVEKERSCPFMVWYYLLVKRYMNTKHGCVQTNPELEQNNNRARTGR